MKFLNVILLSFFSCGLVWQLPAQPDNLIPDPSAENMIECPETLGGYAEDGNGIGRWVPNWLTLRESPDYFNSCSENPSLGWDNPLGYQIPHNGEGYIGAIMYTPQLANYREIVGIDLGEPLIIGESYRITFHTVAALKHSPAPSIGYASGLGVSNIGFLLLTETTKSSLAEGPLPNRATFHLDTALTDTTNWIEISHEFVADSAYSRIAFGNFFDDDSLVLSNPFNLEIVGSAYMFFDDFCVTQVNNDCSYILADGFQTELVSEIKLYPNPTLYGFHVESDEIINGVTVYDIAGKATAEIKNIQSRHLHFEQRLEPGWYLVEINGKKSKMTKKLVVQH